MTIEVQERRLRHQFLYMVRGEIITTFIGVTFVVVNLLLCAGLLLLPEHGHPDGLQAAFVYGGPPTLALMAWGGVILLLRARRRRRLDRAFSPLSLLGSRHPRKGLQYHGIYRDRQVDAYFHPGPGLELHVRTRIGTNMSAGYQKIPEENLQSVPHRQEVVVPSMEWRLWASDREWASRAMDQAGTPELVSHLLVPADSTELPSLLLDPAGLMLYLSLARLDTLTPERMKDLTQNLIELAARFETLPPPARIELPAAPEGNPYWPWLGLLLVVLAILGFLLFIGIALFSLLGYFFVKVALPA